MSTLTCHFHGTSITLHGLRLQEHGQWSGLSSIDDEPAQNTTFSYGFEYTAIVYDWASFSGLDSGSHNLSITNMTAEMQVGLDYAFVAPAADTSLKGETLMVDDTDKSVRLTGPGWAASTTPFGVEGNQANFPFLGTTHGSLNPGDEVEFTFHGSSVAVYGYRQFLLTGAFSVEFSVDNSTATSQTYTSEGTKWNGWMGLSNFLFYSATDLDADSPHTLRITITNSTGSLPFVLDYITYTAEFDTLAQMPTLPPLPEPQPAADTSSEPAGEASSEPTGQPSKLNVGAVVGGGIGATLFILIAALFFFLSRRRSQRNAPRNALETQPRGIIPDSDESPPPYVYEDDDGDSPSPVSQSSSSEMLSPLTPVRHQERPPLGSIIPFTTTFSESSTRSRLTSEKSYGSPV
ncbi:hypothetical protein BDV98DRAFT_564422 [Pterulicium gracile]|uniref:Uncharacterized protein n=1 Tax=Pterulicium gracile TaxID=1884261 RepID=A0A5C3QP07_9AGAR|nr:hypothetical protein BDV98DRAFT_564422 [Pterula gracilis]